MSIKAIIEKFSRLQHVPNEDPHREPAKGLLTKIKSVLSRSLTGEIGDNGHSQESEEIFRTRVWGDTPPLTPEEKEKFPHDRIYNSDCESDDGCNSVIYNTLSEDEEIQFQSAWQKAAKIFALTPSKKVNRSNSF
jgi:hypothetical protein